MKTSSIDEFFKSKGISILICLLVSSMILSIGVSSIIMSILFIIPVLLLFRSRKVIIKPIDILFFLFFFIQALSFFWSANTGSYINEIEKLLVFIFIPLLFIYIRSNNIKLNLNSIIISYLASLIIFILILISFSFFDVISNEKPLIEFISKNVRFNLVELSPISFHTPYIGMYLVFSIVLTIQMKQILPNNFRYFIIILFVFALYLNSNINSYISLIFVSFLILFFKLSKKTLLIFCGSFFLISIITITFYYSDIQKALIYDPADGYWETPGYRILRLLHEGDPTRKETWLASCQIIKDNIWLGTGIGDLTDSLQVFRDENTYAYLKKLNTHNQYLSIFGKTGVFGALIFLMLIINNILVAVKNNSIIYYSFIIITLTAFFTENILGRQWGLIFFCIFNYLIHEHITYFKQ